MFAGNQR